MSSDSSIRSRFARAARQCLPWVLALAVATCTDDSTGPSRGGVGYFSFRPVYTGITASLSQFGIVADSVHVRLTRPVDELVLDTTVFFPPDSASISLALPVALEVSPEVLSAMIEIKAGGTVLFVDTVEVSVVDGPPGSTPPATATLDYVGPGNNIASITIFPADTTIFFGDTLFYTSTAVDSSALPVSNYYVGWKTSDTNKVNSQGRLIAPASRGTIQVIGYTPTGIADTADVTFAPVPSALLADSGAAQVGPVNDSLATLFVARVMAADAQPVEGIHVRFTAMTAGGAVRDTLLVSDANGRVRTRGVFGTTAGAYSWTATIVGTAISANFTGTASAGAPTTIAMQSGNAQVDTAGRALPLPFTARVSDAFNNPIAGVKVYWTRKHGNGAVAADSSFTNGTGLAAVGYTLGAIGTDSVEAKIAGTSATFMFHATAISGAPATMAIVLGNAQSDTVGRLLTDSLAVTVASATAFPVVGTPVVWTVLRGGVVTSDTTLTDSTGRAAVGYTLGTVTGTDSVRAQAGGTSAVFTANALTGAPAAIAVLSGDAQSDTTGLVLPNPFIVRVADAFDNPVAGTKVYWNVVSGGGDLAVDSSFTNGSGQTFAGYTLGPVAGTDTISATLACGCGSVTFTATAIAAAPASIATVSGDSQTVVVNRVADTLAVVVRDGANTPLPGVKVDWAFFPAVGSFTEVLPAGIQSTYTDSLGIARGVYTAGTQAGTVRIEASVAGHIDSLYLFSVADTASAIVVAAGDAQADTAGYVLPSPLIVQVRDAFNNPVAGTLVHWSVVSGSGILSLDSSFTNASGQAFTGYTLGPVAGTDTISATLACGCASVNFTATAIAPIPASIQLFSGNVQFDTAARALSAPLVAQVFSAGFQPIVGTQVVWTVLRGGSLDVDTTVTDSNGVVSANYTLGTLAGTDSVEARTIGGGHTFIFTATVSNDLPAAIAIQSGDGQADTTGFALDLPLVAHVTDAYGNFVAGAEVTFAVTAGGGSIIPDTSFADGVGDAKGFLVLGALAGTNTVRASLSGTSAFVDFTATAITQAPAFLILASGDGQADTVGRALPESLVARVYNASSAPIAGVSVEWTVLRGGSIDVDTTVSDTLGFVVGHYTLGTVAGTDSIQVRTLDGALTQVFTVAAINDAPVDIEIASGDAQSDTSGNVIPLPMVARVVDQFGNGVGGEQVAFTRIAGSGSLFADTLTTDGKGEAAMGYFFGPVPGADTIRATLVATGDFVDFTAITIAGTPASLSFVSGFAQTDTVGRTLAESLMVLVQDIDSRPLGGIPLVWFPQNGATTSADTTVTDSLGHAWVFVTLGTVAGEDTIFVETLGGAYQAYLVADAVPALPSAIAILSGDAQADTAGRTLSIALVAQVTDAYGNPVQGAAVFPSVTAGNGALGYPDTTFSAFDGTVTFSLTLGPVAGTNTVRATLAGTSAFVDFTATSVTAAAGSVVAHAGYGQTDTVGFTLTDSLKILAVDGGSTPLVNAPVVWTVVRGGVVAAETTYTDVGGYSANAYTLGTLAGEDSIEARVVGSVPVALFTATALPGTGTQISIVSGDAQVDTIGSTTQAPLMVLVTDAYGNPSPFQPLVFSVQVGAGLLSSDSLQTDGTGRASVFYTFGALPAVDTIRATLLQNGSFVDFTATAIAGIPTSLMAYSGDGQTDTVLAVLADSLVATLHDASDRPVPGVWLYWDPSNVLVSAESTLTDVNGRAAVEVTLGSSTLTISGVDVRTADSSLTASFGMVIQAGAPAGLSYSDGDAQTGEVGSDLPTLFTFDVTDTWGNPVPNAPVAFTRLAGNGTVSPDTAYTNASGIATAGYTLGGVPGTDTISVTLPATGQEFILTAFTVAGPAASLSYVIGTGQSDTVARALPTPFRVNVQDALGNPRSDVWVRFTKTAATGVLAADSVLTDVTGVAEVAYTLGTVTGFDSVTATVAGLTDTVAFYAFAENEVAATIAVFSGDSGGASVGGITGLPVIFVVRDVYGNPVGDQSVGFFATPGSSSPQTSETTTGDDGLASAGFWTMDAAPGYNTLTAQTGSFTATATAIGMPIGTTSMWAGVTSSDWDTPSNWFSGVVPDINDTVFIPAGTPNDPDLSASVSLGRVVVAGAVTIDMGVHNFTSANGIEGSAAVFSATSGLVSIHGGTWDATATNLQVDSTTLGSGAVTGDLTVAGPDGFDMAGHTLVVPGNVTTYGPLYMNNEADSLDIGGDFTVNYTDMGGATSGGTIVLRGDFTSSSLFRPVGSNLVVFAGADTQYATFSDASSSWFHHLTVDNGAGVQFLSNMQVKGDAQQVNGRLSGNSAAVGGSLIVAADSAWAFTFTSFTGSTFSAPDTIFGSVSFEFAAPVTLPGDFTVLGDLYMNGPEAVDVGPNTLRTTGGLSQLYQSGGLIVPASASTVEVGGNFGVVANTNDFSNGTLILHGGMVQNGGSIFRPSSTFTTRFVGTAGQSVIFATGGPGATQSSFGPVEIADSVSFGTNSWFLWGVTMQAGGKVTGAALSINGDLAGSTWDNWRPGSTTFEATVSSLPDSLYGNVEFVTGFTLAKAFTVGGQLQVYTPSAEVDLNGFPLTVGGDFYLAGTARMENASDSLDVGGTLTWYAEPTSGQLTDGVIVARGAFFADRASSSFTPSGAHRVVFDGPDPHIIQTQFVSASNNSFNHVELRGTGGLHLTTYMQVNGAFTESEGTPLTIMGNQALSLQGAVALDGVIFDSTGLVIDSDSLLSLAALTFRNRPAATNLELAIPGIEGTTSFQDFVFEDSVKDGGAYYVRAQDRSSNSYPVVIHMVGSTPLDGGAFTQTPLVNDGATVLWSHLQYQSQPLGGEAGSLLSSVDVRVVGPNGVTLTGYSGDLTIGIASNPANGTLFGTTTVTASGGLASFSDLLIDSVGTDYKLVVTGNGLGPVVSDDFDITVPLPVGFTTAWVGGVSNDWNNGANWSTGVVPDDSANVFISLPYANAPVSTGSVLIGRLQVAPGANLEVASSVFQADSSIEVYGTITGAGSFQPAGVGFITGDIQAQTIIGTGADYSVTGTLRVSPELAIGGQLLVSGGDSLVVTGLFGTVGGTGVLVQNDVGSVVLVDGDAWFDGASTDGTLTDGLFLVSGALGTGGSSLTAYAPSATHNTILNGTGIQTVYFTNSDSTLGSHFGHLQVSTTGNARMDSPVWITGNLLVANGATFEDTLGYGVAVFGTTTVDLGATLRPSRFASQGVVNVAGGATYSVPLTVYFGNGAPLPVRAAPYDTLLISRDAYAYEGFTAFGDLRIQDGWGAPARFDLQDETVSVAYDLTISGDAVLVMQDAGGQLNVGGNFSTNGGDSRGLLTAGTLQIDGSFDQDQDGSSEAFRAGGTHTTVFTTAGTGRHIDFASPSQSPSDSSGSHFRILQLGGPVDTLQSRVVARSSITVTGSLVDDEGFGLGLASYGSITFDAGADSLSIGLLESWGTLNLNTSPLYNVDQTRLYGGGGVDLPALTYKDLQIANGGWTLGANQVINGDLTIGTYCGEGGECSLPGDLTVNGFDLIITGRLGVMGYGQLHMAAGDSVDVTGDLTYRTSPSDGNLTGGTLVARAMFNTVGSGAFQADSAHWTVLAAPGMADLYPTSNTWFGNLLILDGGLRRIRSSEAVVVRDTLMLGNAASILADTAFSVSGEILVQGPVITVAGSSIQMEGSVQFDHDTILIAGDYLANQTVFSGPNTDIPALTYRNITVLGTARMTDSIDVTGYTVNVGGSLDLGAYTLRTQDFVTTGMGNFTMAFPSTQLVVDGDATFGGGGTAGLLTNGTATFKGNFTQSSTNDSASYFAVSNHTTVFADSGFGGSAAIIESMSPTTSRFNNLTITGTGVSFYGATWIGGDVAIVSPSMDSVGGSLATIGGNLTDPNYKWMVDSTRFMADHPAIPDSIDGTVELMGRVDLGGLQRIGGSLTIHDTLMVAGYSLYVTGDFAAVEGGLLQTIDGTDDVRIGGNALFNGATATGQMTGGSLRIFGDLTVGPDSAFSFDATGTHSTLFTNGIGGSTVTFAAGSAGGFQNVDYANSGLTITSDILVRGDLSSSGETAGPIYGGAHYVRFGTASSVEQGVEFNNTRVRIPQSVTLFDLDFTNQDPDSTQIMVVGAGSPEALQLGNIRFHTLPTTGRLVYAIDTLENGDSLVVQMMSSTPFSPVAYGAGVGEGRVDWGHLAVTSFPFSVDSLVPFTVAVTFINPDSSLAGLGASATISLATDPAGSTLGGTLNRGTSFSAITFDDLTLDKVATGISFFIAVDGQPTDTITTGLLDVINPAPLGSIAWDGEGGDGLWNTAANWAGDVIPGASDSAFIGGGQAIIVPDSGFSIGGLVLGQGASLSIDPVASLSITGRLTAGNTIYGSGSLILAGSAMPVSGAINAPTTINGTVTTVGQVSFGNDLVVDGPGAELNVGGATVTVYGVFSTANGGILTMDGPTDSLIVNEAGFNGGSTSGTLTAGTLIITGADLSQAGPSPSAFAPSGTHTTIFEDAGDNTNVSFNDPSSSFFANLVVRTPNSVNLSSPNGHALVGGDLTLDDDGALTGDTLGVQGNVVMGGSSANLSLGQVSVGGAASQIQGNWNVEELILAGTAQGLPAFDAYNRIVASGIQVNVMGPVRARSITVTSGLFNTNGTTVSIDTLDFLGTGSLGMLQSTDTIVVDSFARFQAGNSILIAGLLELHGDLKVGDGPTYFNAAPTHTTRINGAPSHFLDLPGEASATFGTLIVDTGTANIDQDFSVTGDLFLNDGAVLNNNDGNPVLTVLGNILGDTGSNTGLDFAEINAYGGLSFNGDTANFQVPVVRMWASGATIQSGFPFRTLMVLGSATLGGVTQAEYLVIDGSGDLLMGGNTLTVDSIIVNSNAHLRMQSAADQLTANGWAMFQGDSSEGDYTAGTIRAAKFIQTTGPSGDPRSFAQTGTHRLAPLDGDTIVFLSSGPFGSRLKSLTFDGAGSSLYFEGRVWIDDSLAITGSGGQLVGLPGSDIIVGYPGGNTGTVLVGASSALTLDSLGTSGTLDVQGSYTVGLTKFLGDAQAIPTGISYRDVQVQYGAYLTGALTLPAGRTFEVGNFGDLALAGHILTVDTFRTSGFGVLRMQNALDTLRSAVAFFGGGSTAGLMTVGGIETGMLFQSSSTDTASFAPSGTHTTTFANIGSFSESGRDFSFETPSVTASHFAHVNFTATDGVNALSNVYVTGSTYINNTFDGLGRSLTSEGPVNIGPGATVELDTLRLLDTITIDPSAGMTIGITVFGPGAAPMPASYVWGNVGIEGVQTLTGDVSLGNSLILLKAGELHLNGHKISMVNDLAIYDSARLVMSNALDTVAADNAYFFGDSTGGDLSAGAFALQGGILQSDSVSPKSFAPTGTRVRFVGNDNAFVTFETPDSANGSYFRDVTVEGNTGITFQTGVTTTGILQVDVSAYVQFNSGLTGADPVHHWGPVIVLPGGAYSNTSFATSTFHVVPSVLGSFAAQYARLDGVPMIPNLPWNNLQVRNGGSIALTGDLTLSGFLGLEASSPGAQDLALSGYNISASGFSTSEYATVTMTNAADTIDAPGGVFFYGGDETGKMTSGIIRSGGGFMEGSSTSTTAFYSTGTVVEFTNTSSQAFVQMANAATVQFDGIKGPNASSLWLRFNNDFKNVGNMSAYVYNLESNPGVTVTADTMYFGLSGGGLVDIDRMSVTALVTSGPVPTWSVGYTEVLGSQTLPNLLYDTLVVQGADTASVAGLGVQHLSVNGSLAVGPGATVNTTGDVVVAGPSAHFSLYGGTVNVGRDFITTGGATFGMDSTASALAIFRDAKIGGGSSIGLLNQGTMQIGNDFDQSGNSFSFVANPGHTTLFTGGNEHAITLADPLTTEFARISLQSAVPNADTLLILAPQLRAGILKVNGYGRIRSDTAEIRAKGLDVQGAFIERTQIIVATPTPSPMTFNDVLFSGFDASNTQLEVASTGSSMTLQNVDFDNVANGTSGFYVRATDTDAISIFLFITIQGPDYLTGLAKSLLTGGANLNFQPPS
jgi:adhesin/invasin